MTYVNERFFLLKQVADLIAETFGKNCEVSIHDLEKSYDKTIVYIRNGHVTGRKVGDSGTNEGLKLISGKEEINDKYNYLTVTRDKKIIKASTLYIKDEEGKLVGSICINYDITSLAAAQRELEIFTSMNEMNWENEIYVSNVDELLQFMIKEEISNIGKPIEEFNKDDKKKVIKKLDDKGALQIQKSSEIISEALHISKFTFYNYLKEK